MYRKNYLDLIDNTLTVRVPTQQVRMLIDKNEDMTTTTKDWRKALRSQPAYRVVNRTLRSQTQFITTVAGLGLFILIILYAYPRHGQHLENIIYTTIYNHTYPLTTPLKTPNLHRFRIGIIADMDTKSKSTQDDSSWHSYLKKGYLDYKPKDNSLSIKWDTDEPIKLTGGYALKGRGMELSELVVFDGRLLTFDDRTGLIYEIQNDNQVVPWVLLVDGDGRNPKGFKSEWATVKDEKLYVGSMGKEWTTSSGHFVNNNPQYVKIITPKGQVEHVKWVQSYEKLRESIGIRWPGYMIHESATWSSANQRWYFLPRRCSPQQYNETLDEKRGCAVLITADPNFMDIRVVKLGLDNPARGFSSFKFVPTTNDRLIIALRTEELNGNTATYLTAFNIEGQILLNDTFISDLKYEGLEFI